MPSWSPHLTPPAGVMRQNSLFLLWPKCPCYFSLIRAHSERIYPQALASPTVPSLPINKLSGILLATQSPLGVFRDRSWASPFPAGRIEDATSWRSDRPSLAVWHLGPPGRRSAEGRLLYMPFTAGDGDITDTWTLVCEMMGHGGTRRFRLLPEPNKRICMLISHRYMIPFVLSGFIPKETNFGQKPRKEVTRGGR